MIDSLLLLLLNLLVIVGFERVTRYGLDVNRKPMDKEALWFVRRYAKAWLGKWSKPVCTCIVCMSSLHSVYIFWPVYGFEWYNLYLYAVYVLALAGLTAIYDRISP